MCFLCSHHTCLLQDAQAACLADAGPPRRCAGFLWRAVRAQRASTAHSHVAAASAGSFLPLSFERVTHTTRHLDDVSTDVYQHACWPLEGTTSVVAVMTTVPRPKGVSYVARAAASVLSEALPLLVVAGNGHEGEGEASEAETWAFAQPGGVRFVRIPDDVTAAASSSKPPTAVRRGNSFGGQATQWGKRQNGRGSRMHRPARLPPRRLGPTPTRLTVFDWRARESAHWAWAVDLALMCSDAPFVLYLEDDMLLAQGAGDDLVDRLREWATRGKGPSNATQGAEKATAKHSSPAGLPPVRRANTPQPPIPDFPGLGWLGLSLWSADDLPDGHACANCYTKALVLPRHNAAVLARYVAAWIWDKPVDWLIADIERNGGGRLRALVPNLAEHVGDQSSLAGMRREWQRSAWFKKHPFTASGEGGHSAAAG